MCKLCVWLLKRLNQAKIVKSMTFYCFTSDMHVQNKKYGNFVSISRESICAYTSTFYFACFLFHASHILKRNVEKNTTTI